jgi:hypothetical protein
MDYQIMPIGIFEQRVIERAHRDHAAGVPLADCEYNPGSHAEKTRKAEYARLDAQAQVSPESHTAPAAGRQFDVQQETA